MNETNEVFEPHNSLESKLLAAQEGQISAEEFMRELVSAQVFMPVRDKYGIEGFQDSREAVPLTLKDDAGEQIVVLFTSPERAKPFLADYPEYEGGLLAEFSWVIEKVGTGIGISLNPGSAVGIDMAADMLEQLASLE